MPELQWIVYVIYALIVLLIAIVVVYEMREKMAKRMTNAELDNVDGVLYITEDEDAIGCWCDLYQNPEMFEDGQRVVFIIEKVEE